MVVGLAAWGLVLRTSEDAGPPTPTGEPPPGATATMAAHDPWMGPPPWVLYPTPLEGRWARAGSPAPLVTVVVSDGRLDVWLGTPAHPERRLLNHLEIRVRGDRLQVRDAGEPDEVATYRWRLHGDRLTLRLLQRPPGASDLLAAMASSSSPPDAPRHPRLCRDAGPRSLWAGDDRWHPTTLWTRTGR